MEDQDKNIKKKAVSPDLSKAKEEYEKEILKGEMGTEMLDYGSGGPDPGRDDSSARSDESTRETSEESGESPE